MTEFFLIRHGVHDLIGRVLTGRKVDVALNRKGVLQVKRAAEQLHALGVDRILSSPRLRALQTAEIIARFSHLPVETATALDETDFGHWAGLSFDVLARDPQWALWNGRRNATRPPSGESMGELQARIVGFLQSLSREFPAGRIAIVGHAEPIRAVLLHARKLPLDRFLEVTVRPAAIHALSIEIPGGVLAEIFARSSQRGAA